MRSFSEYNVDFNEKKLRSASKIFEKQLQTSEGSDLIIDGIQERGIIYNDLNPLSEDKEYRELRVRRDLNIKRGGYVEYDKDTYIITSDIDNHFVYDNCKMRKCNQILKWKGQETGIHCIFTSNSYGAKGETHTNPFISDFDSRAMVLVQRNEFTDSIYEGMRFVLGSEWDIYEVTKKIGASMDNLWHLTVKYTRRVVEDDIVNGIAWNNYDIATSEKVGFIYSITGSESIIFNNIESYSFKSKDTTKVLWSIDEDSVKLGIAEIISQDSINCEIKALKKDTVFTLCARAMDTNELLTTYTIMTTRK